MASLWGLTAMALGQRDLASQFFQLAVQTRCYQAPFLAQSPLLDPYRHEPVLATFLDEMAEIFPTIRQPSGALVNTSSPR